MNQPYTAPVAPKSELFASPASKDPSYKATVLANDHEVPYQKWDGSRGYLSQAAFDAKMAVFLAPKPTDEERKVSATGITWAPMRKEFRAPPKTSYSRMTVLAAAAVAVNESRCDCAANRQEAKLWADSFLVLFQRLRVDRARGPELSRDLATLVHRFIDAKWDGNVMEGGILRL